MWYASVYTDNLATTRDDKRGGNLVVMDAGKRDRMVFPGDLGIEGLTDYYSVAPAPQIMHDSLYLFACQQQQDGSILLESQINVVCPPGDPGPATIPVSPVRLGEYTAWYIVDAYDYYLYTGDEALIRTILPVLRRSVQFLTNNAPRGLYFGAPGEVNWHPSDTAYGESSDTNAVYYEALRDIAALERQVAHDEAAAVADDQQAARLRSMMMGLLWDSNAGAFLVSTMDPYANHPQDGNVQAVVAGLLMGRTRHAPSTMCANTSTVSMVR